MIQFLKEIYLTGFTIFFRISRPKDIAYKAGFAIGGVTLIQSFILIGIFYCIQMFLNKQILLSKPALGIAVFILFLINEYILYIRKHGIKFEREFNSLKKSRKNRLVAGYAVVTVAAIVFLICSAIAYRHFFGIKWK